jgi:hypothetical protein
MGCHRVETQGIQDRDHCLPLGFQGGIGAMESVATIAKEHTFLVLGPNLFDECGNAGIPSHRMIRRLAALPKHLLMKIKISMAIVDLKDGQ